jgi:hypothetical protein
MCGVAGEPPSRQRDETMKTVIFIVALLTISTAHAADPSDVEDTPKPARFQPWQRM